MRGPRHVVLVLDSPTYGGAEQCVVQLVRALPAAVARTVLATEPVPRQLAAAVRDSGWPLRTTPPVRGTPGGPERVAEAVAALHPDVVHVNLIDPATCVDALDGAVSAGSPTVADVHMTGTLGAGDPRRRLAATYAACSAVTARSRRIADLVRDGLAVPADRVHVVRNGVPVGPAARPRAARGRRPAGEPARIRCVGRLTAQKGFDLLLAATRRLIAAGHDLDVAVAGDGRDRDVLVRQADGLPVRFVGFVADVPAFLAGADLFCLPSRAEALPLALLEAVVAGLPCVAADVGDIAEVLGDLVVVVPPEDVDALTAALAELLVDPARRQRLGDRARREGVRRFDERTTVGAVLDVYRRACTGTTAPTR